MTGPDDIPGGARVNLVGALSVAQHLPAEALERALDRPDRVADAVLAVLDRAAGGGDLTPREANLLFWGVHVLGAARDGRLFAPLLRLARGPAERVGEWLGEAVPTTLPRMLIGTFEGSAGPLLDLLADREADEFVRWSVFGALARLTRDGAIARADTEAFLERFDTEHPARAGDTAWTGWAETIALLGLERLAPRVVAAYADARLLVDEGEEDWFGPTLADALADPDGLERFEARDLRPIDDLVADLEAALASDEEADPPEPVRNPLRTVGRNDPCPCRSGLKFKKCCIGKAA